MIGYIVTSDMILAVLGVIVALVYPPWRREIITQYREMLYNWTRK